MQLIALQVLRHTFAPKPEKTKSGTTSQFWNDGVAFVNQAGIMKARIKGGMDVEGARLSRKANDSHLRIMLSPQRAGYNAGYSP